MKTLACSVLFLLATFPASAQVSVEEATAKLKERAAAHPAATQPATQPIIGPELIQLRKENAALKAEVEKLKGQLAAALAPKAEPVKVKARLPTRDEFKEMLVGMSVDTLRTYAVGHRLDLESSSETSKFYRFAVMTSDSRLAFTFDVTVTDGKVSSFSYVK